MNQILKMITERTASIVVVVSFMATMQLSAQQQPEVIRLESPKEVVAQPGQPMSMSNAKPVVAPAPQGQTIGTVVTLTGFMLNGNTLTPVEANYAVYEGGKKVGQSRKSNAADGFLVTGLKPGGSYTIRVEDPRYFREEFAIALPSASKYTEISKDFIVRPMEAGKKIAVNPAPFDLRKNTIKSGMDEDLARLAQMLTMNPGVNIELICYPDDEGPAANASSVSTARGNALKAAFEKAGISGSRMSVKTVNSVDPINPPPLKKSAKGKRYVGSVYILVTKV